MANSYTKAGVNVQAGYDTVSRIKAMAAQTYDGNVLGGLGGFGGFYALNDAKGMREPVLVSGADGVGTKLRIAMAMRKHDTIGIDCVAMCVNDIACHGAKPLFFLDYLAVGALVPERAAEIVRGVSQGCLLAGCALIGGETAEMPGFYDADEYDIAGFAVGLVDRADVIDGSAIKAGDVLLGLPSSGAHSNGYSLIRRVFDIDEKTLTAHVGELGATLGEALLAPTRIYTKAVLAAKARVALHGVAHITGGGFIENVPRIIPDGLCAVIERGRCQTPPLFDLIERAGGLERMEMYNIFNMGIGMVVAVAADEADEAVSAFAAAGQEAFVIGRVEEGETKVRLG
jgi:phosphoribosylformylglycinamidine cyclo-ligase